MSDHKSAIPTDIDTQIDEILAVLAHQVHLNAHSPGYTKLTPKNQKFLKEAHKAIKTLLIQQQGGYNKPSDTASVGGNQVDTYSEFLNELAAQRHTALTKYGGYADHLRKVLDPLDELIRDVLRHIEVTDLAVADHNDTTDVANPQSKASLKRELNET